MPFYPYRSKKKQTAPSMEWQQESCPASEVAQRIDAISSARWVVKHIFWAGVPGQMEIVKMQSSLYAPKPVKVKKPKKAKAPKAVEPEQPALV